jgi:sugar transferase (PEP-CTERM/EpsH1 system associated)
MRILFLAHRLPYPPNKGDKVRSFWELQQLSDRHEVDLFCFYDDPNDERFLPALRNWCREVYAERISPWRSRFRCLAALLLGKPFTPAYFHSRTMAQQVRQALASRKYDIIFVFSSSMAPYVERSTSRARILDMVDVDSEKWEQFAAWQSWPISWIWRCEAERLAKLEGQLLEQFQTTLLCTAAEAGLLRDRVPSAPIQVLENFIDTGYFDPAKVSVSPEIEALRPYVIFTGSMDYFPNVDAVRHFYDNTFNLLKLRAPSLKFVIAGRNPTGAVLHLAKDPRVIVTGSVADVRPYLKGAIAAVAPMRVARGVQNKILEAMAMGLPVLASCKSSAALPHALTSHLITEDNPDQMADYLVDILRDGPTAPVARIREAILEFVRDVDPGERLRDIIEGSLKLDKQQELAVSTPYRDQLVISTLEHRGRQGL